MVGSGKEVVLVTGGSGFLGQNIVKMLQELDPLCQEIRVLDVKEYENKIGHAETKKMTSFIADICEGEEVIGRAFEGVDCVFHCAAYINFQFPPNLDELERVNVNGTKNVINLCIKYNVPKLVFTSTSAVTLIPYMGSNMTIIVNQTESKAKTPTSDSAYLIPGYPSSKLRAEKLISSANGSRLQHGQDYLRTVSLRPTIMYGEGDTGFMPTLLKIGQRFGGQLPKLVGAGGKQQLTYVGNVAWAHICAKNVLGEAAEANKVTATKIGGFPVFVTDDTPIEDTIRFCQRLSNVSKLSARSDDTSVQRIKLRPTWWSIPAFISYFLAFLLEIVVRLFNLKLNFPPRGMISYLSSIIMYSRLRASLHLDYDPIFNEEESIGRSVSWYEKWYRDYLNQLDKKQLSLESNSN